jgi:hypothetical protein
MYSQNLQENYLFFQVIEIHPWPRCVHPGEKLDVVVITPVLDLEYPMDRWQSVTNIRTFWAALLSCSGKRLGQLFRTKFTYLNFIFYDCITAEFGECATSRQGET